MFKKAPVENEVDADEILPEYDFSNARPNKYASRFAAGRTGRAPRPRCRGGLPASTGEVNDALRALAGIISKHGPQSRNDA